MFGQQYGNPYLQPRVMQQPIQSVYPTTSYAPTFMQIKGRPVTNIEEARAAQIDFDGSSTYFPSVSEGKIYEKAIDLNGAPVFKVYELAKPQEKKEVNYAEAEQVKLLQQKVDMLEQKLNSLGGMRYEPVTNNANAAISQQSVSYDAITNRQQSNVSAGNENGTGQESHTNQADNTQPRQRAWYE